MGLKDAWGFCSPTDVTLPTVPRTVKEGLRTPHCGKVAECFLWELHLRPSSANSKLNSSRMLMISLYQSILFFSFVLVLLLIMERCILYRAP